MTDEIITDTAYGLSEKIKNKQLSAQEITKAFIEQIDKKNESINAFLYINKEEALKTAKKVDDLISENKELPSRLSGVPIALKDVFTTTDAPTTCGSKMLENWISPYDSTVTTKLRDSLIPILGKTNMDEFAMGSSTENSAYGPTKNPWNITKTPGGSGGGSAAALASGQAPLAIGTDTGGSIRQPAALTGTVGVKPTYGTVSRYGLVACASSLDQGGPCAKTVLDTAMLHEVISGYDPKDGTSVNKKLPSFVDAAISGMKEVDQPLKGIKIGVVSQLLQDGYQKGVKDSFDQAVETLTKLGAEIVTVSCPSFEYSLAAYYLILPSEVSSNLARFDAMRYGKRFENEEVNSADEVMAESRQRYLGPEVKRRIMIGTYALSAGQYDKLYGKALQVRTKIIDDFNAAFDNVDVLISPTTPTTAFGLGEKVDDPLAMYLFDLCTLPINLAGNCAISIPSGIALDTQLPTGLQIIAPSFCDDRLYRIGAAYEKSRGNFKLPI